MILCQPLMATGRKFSSETDTEIVAHLVDAELKAGVKELGDAVRNALKQVEGAYALVVLSDSHPDRLVCAKVASPMVLGVGEGENFVASDIPAILSHTRNMILLEDGQVAELTAQRVAITDLAGRTMSPPVKNVVWNSTQAKKNGFKQFMLKEIHEQPRPVTDTLRGCVVLLDQVQLDPASIKKIIIVACGTSNHAGMVGKFMIEQLARIIIRRGVKMDNLIQIAHNVEVGKNTVIAAQVGISGSTKVGENCMIAGQVGIAGHLAIANQTSLGAQTGVSKSITEEGQRLLGYPAIDIKDYFRSYAVYKKLPEIVHRLRYLEKKAEGETPHTVENREK